MNSRPSKNEPSMLPLRQREQLSPLNGRHPGFRQVYFQIKATKLATLESIKVNMKINHLEL